MFPALYLLPGAMRPDPDLIAFGCFYLDALVERGVEVLNVEVVGDAYAIASNYLRKSGVIPDTFATNERLLGIIVKLFQRGELNRLRLANRAIAKFEAETLVVA